jgi:hypothetical protein
MILEELIKYLESKDADIVVPGFDDAMSYRGYYEELGFSPCESTTIGEMLELARKQIGAEYHGYKGGKFTMGEYTDCYLAPYGRTGDEINAGMIDGWIANAKMEALETENAELKIVIEGLCEQITELEKVAT